MTSKQKKRFLQTYGKEGTSTFVADYLKNEDTLKKYTETLDMCAKGKEKGEFIELSVIDNGVGMTEEQAKTILTSDSKGYGVRNVNERIKLFYGAQYSLKVMSKMGEGTEVLVCIPKK